MSTQNGIHTGDEPRLPDVLPVLALKNSVVFPYLILPLSVSRERGIRAVDHALADNRVLMLVTQKDPGTEEPTAADLSETGTAALVLRMLKLPDGRIRILTQGLGRARVEHLAQTDPFLKARIRQVFEPAPEVEGIEVEALVRLVKENLEQVAGLGHGISSDVMILAANIQAPGRLADLVAGNLDLDSVSAQRILGTIPPVERLREVSELLVREVQLLTMQHEISSVARGEMDRGQREYFLRQQLKAIQHELGEEDEIARDVAAFRSEAAEKKLSPEAMDELEKQLRRLERSQPDSAESGLIRTHLEWLTGLPWSTLSEDHLDLDDARRVLDEDHYDLDRVKERILEYLAVRKLNPEARGPILCFVGPPGVGKTSLGRSIARALGREFARISLGGIRDEAEIRGHRRTYVGALPGRILQGIQQAGTGNPVFMLDEIDKIGSDFRGDPSSALLEVLDPEQNSSFRDHYLGVAYDLSSVLFITTANLLDPIQPAFLDRMEVIRLSGYTAEEKLHIARRHLLPKLLDQHGLAGRKPRFSNAALRRVVTEYTQEAGLRNLERELATIFRKVAVAVARGEEGPRSVTKDGVAELLGPARHFSEELLSRDRVGVATGLAWTAAGGDLLFIEVVAVPGKGRLRLTGQLGEVMQESAQAALSYARVCCADNGLPEDFFSKHDLHIHVPAGSVPKDGPSAGITIATAIVSVLRNRAVRRRVAMTGEITLRGDVLPIGGVREKILAAKTAGIEAVVAPRLNDRDLQQIPEELRKGLSFHLVEHMSEVLELALEPETATRAGRPADPRPEHR